MQNKVLLPNICFPITNSSTGKRLCECRISESKICLRSMFTRWRNFWFQMAYFKSHYEPAMMNMSNMNSLQEAASYKTMHTLCYTIAQWFATFLMAWSFKQFLMLWRPPTIKLFHCYFMTVTFLLLRTVSIWYADYLIWDP